MPDIEYDSISMTDGDFREVLLKALNAAKQCEWGSMPWNFTNYPATLSAVNDVQDTDNTVWNIWASRDTYFNTRYWNSGYSYCCRIRQGFKLEVMPNKRACIVRAKSRVQQRGGGNTSITDALVDIWMIVAQDVNSIKFTSRHAQYGSGAEAYPFPMQQTLNFDNGGQISAGTPSTGYNAFKSDNNSLVTTTNALRKRNSDNGFNNLHLKGAHLAKLSAIRAHNSDYGWSWNGYDEPLSGHQFSAGFPQVTGDSNFCFLCQPERLPSGFPIFNLETATAAQVIAYLDTGKDEGSEDPFNPKDPVPVVITDYKTNFTLFATADVESQRNHFSLLGSNSQFNQYIDSLEYKYAVYAYNYSTAAGHSGSLINIANRQNPTVGWLQDRLTTGSTRSYLFYFSDYPATFDPLSGTSSNSSGGFIVNFSFKPAVALKQVVSSVYYHNMDTGAETPLSKDDDFREDGYRWTAPTGETFTILFRAIGLSDLRDRADTKYIQDNDEENGASGSDQTFAVGTGFGTYAISSDNFDTINRALWASKWTLVSQPDPIQAVISCVQIPFDNTAGTASPVFLGSKETEVVANKVNPVKSYTINSSVIINPIRGDFSDIYYSRVKIYLPFIGWKELPASEVISRSAYSAVGLDARVKTLTFKYIVDFITGDCRCIVMINGTERFFFDGTCGANVPMTSNNHQAAEAKSNQAKVAAGVSILGAVGSAMSGNYVTAGLGLVGAVASIPSMVPQYSYSASSSPSGYIESSMSRTIMVVVEAPVVQEPSSFSHKVGKPCQRNLTLGTLNGFTKCVNPNTSSINCTPEEHRMLQEILSSGVYL